MLKKVLLKMIRLYQKYLSPLKMGSTCRFEPTCSNYTFEAIEKHGVFKGIILGFVRISKCGPWHPGGVDLVP